MPTDDRFKVTACPECGSLYMPGALHHHRQGCPQPPQEQIEVVPAPQPGAVLVELTREELVSFVAVAAEGMEANEDWAPTFDKLRAAGVGADHERSRGDRAVDERAPQALPGASRQKASVDSGAGRRVGGRGEPSLTSPGAVDATPSSASGTDQQEGEKR